MKIIEENPTRLILKQKSFMPYVIGVIFTVVGLYLLLIFTQKNAKSTIIGLIFVMAGIIPVVFNKFMTIVLDKTTRIITIVNTGLLGKKTETMTFDELKEVAIEEYVTTSTAGNSMPRNQLSYNLVLYKKDGQGFPIHIDSPSSTFIGSFPVLDLFKVRNTIMEMGNKIAVFIGVPFIDRRPPTLTEVVSNISTTMQNNKPQEQPALNQQATQSIQN